MKNWKYIAGIENVLVRQMLIRVAEGNTMATTLAEVQPLAFQPIDGEKKEPLTVRDLMILAGDMKPWHFKAMMEEEGIPFETIVLQGECVRQGEWQDISYYNGQPNDGFLRTKKRPGEKVSHKGINFFVIANTLVEGNVTMPDCHGLILVAEEHFASTSL